MNGRGRMKIVTRVPMNSIPCREPTVRSGSQSPKATTEISHDTVQCRLRIVFRNELTNSPCECTVRAVFHPHPKSECRLHNYVPSKAVGGGSLIRARMADFRQPTKKSASLDSTLLT